MPILGLAFDLEGTVIDVEKAHHDSHLLTADEIGVHITLDEAFIKIPHFIGGPDDEICAEIWALSNKATPLEKIKKIDRYYYHQLIKEITIVPRPGFLKFLKEAEAVGLKKSIGSLTEKAEAKLLLERSDLIKYFDYEVMVFREDVEHLKPAPDVYLATALRMGIHTTEQLVFEDSPRGVQAAISAGSRVLGMPVFDRKETVEPLKAAGAEIISLDWQTMEIKKILAQFS